MPPISASPKASSSDRPVPQKGHIATPYVLPPPATHPSLGVHHPPYPSFRPVYLPRSGLFMPVSNQILVGKSVSPVFSETKLLNFQIWLGQRGFFSKMWREFWRGQKALSPGRTRGVGRFSRPVALSGRFSRSACRRLTARPGLDHCRRARSGSARPPIWPGAFSARRGIFRFCPVRPYLRPGGPVVRPARDRGRMGRFWASCGLLAGLLGLVMMAGGRARSIWGAGRALFPYFWPCLRL